MIGIHGILVGVAEMIASFMSGWIGDRYGRKVYVLSYSKLIKTK